MQLVFRPEARRELLEAQAWYEVRSLIYHATESELVVVSCFHHRRKPGVWLRNVPANLPSL